MTDPSRKYRSKHLQNQFDIAQRLKDAMTRAGDKIAALRNDPNAKRVKGLSFKDNYKLDKTIGSIMTGLQGELLSITESAISTSWDFSNQKNDIITQTYLDGLKGFKGEVPNYYNHNQEALKSFISRKTDSKTLSDRVWTSVDAFRDEMEVHLGLGLANGDSAAVISQRIRQYLNNPEQLFRRVRNEAGKLGLSQNAQQFHPGQGVYRSSYKNALRVTRSETNMAYLESDHLRWKSMDFVIGVKIELSAQHPIADICDSMAGNYPKDYKFIGFHSQCLCHATPILMPQSDFVKYLQGEAVEVNEIVDVPKGHKDWIEANKTRMEGWKSKPYFIRDNYKNGDVGQGLSFKIPEGIKISNEPIKFNLGENEMSLLKQNGFTLIDQKAFNKSMDGFDLVDFDKRIQSIFDHKGIKITSKYLDNNGLSGDAVLMYKGNYKGQEFKMNRIFKEKDGVKTVFHGELLIPKDLQGSGIGMKLINESYTEYQKIGIQKIELHAGHEVGGYVWGRCGFKAKYNQLEKLNDHIYQQNVNGSITFGEDMKISKYLKSIKEGEMIDMFEISNMPFGKRLLLGSDWAGELNLTDDLSRTIFENYLKSKI